MALELELEELREEWFEKTPSELRMILKSFEVDEENLFSTLREKRIVIKALKAFIEERNDDIFNNDEE